MARRVLIVDDEPDVTSYVSTALRAHGFDAVVANSVESGLRLLAETSPDMVFLDIMMPRESGLSMYLRLREDPTTRSVPVVILSGVAQKGQFDFRAYVSDRSIPEPDYYLEKPVPVNELVEVAARFASGATHPEQRRGDHA